MESFVCQMGIVPSRPDIGISDRGRRVFISYRHEEYDKATTVEKSVFPLRVFPIIVNEELLELICDVDLERASVREVEENDQYSLHGFEETYRS